MIVDTIPVNFIAGDRTVTFQVIRPSMNAAGVITVGGSDVIDISPNYKPGDIEVEIGGTAGASGKLLIAKAAFGNWIDFDCAEFEVY